VLLSCSIATAILDESRLTFRWLGAQPLWRKTLPSARSYTFDEPWYTAIAGIALSATDISLNLVGDAMRDVGRVTEVSSRTSSMGLQVFKASA
jgi:ABC-type dipeptide/oligopeptide/nickel transport system permease subunit